MEDQQAFGDAVSSGYARLSKSELDARLNKLLAQPLSVRSLDESQRLLYELQVHQIELELQNRMLRESSQELEEACDRYADLFDFAPVGYLTLDPNGRILEINLRAAAMFGRERRRLIGAPLIAFLAQGDSRPLLDHLAQVFKTQERVVHELRLKVTDDHPMVVRLESIAVERGNAGEKTCRSALIDITAQHQVEAELKEKQQQFRAIFEQAAVGVAMVDSLSGKFLQANRKFSDISGYSDWEILKLDFAQITHSGDLQQDILYFQQLMAGEIRDFELEKRLIRKDGSIAWVRMTVSSMGSWTNPPASYIAVINDISTRKHVETVLEGRRQVLESIAVGAPLGTVLNQLVLTTEQICPQLRCAVLLLDEERRCLRIGAAPNLPDEFRRCIIESKSDEHCILAGGDVVLNGESVIIEDITAQPEYLEYLAPLEQAGLRACWVVPVQSKDGDVLGAFVTYHQQAGKPSESILDFARGSASLVGIALERQRSEDRVHQHQDELAHMARLNMMGEMATGMAHELNQPLSAVATYTDIALRLIRDGNQNPTLVEEALDGAREQAMHASEIIRHLRQLVRKQPSKRVNVDINELIGNVVNVMQFELRKHHVHVLLELDQHLPSVMVDNVQLEQVFMNLLRNSIEAMYSADSQIREVSIHTAISGDGVVKVVVGDTGPGITLATAERLFEPFVTTKGAAGMGMGLSICRSIIEAHGGRLWAESEPGQGAKFFLVLPLNK